MPTFSGKKTDVVDASFQENPLFTNLNNQTGPVDDSNFYNPNQSQAQTFVPKKKTSVGKVVSLILIAASIVFLGIGGFFAYSLISAGGNSLGQGTGEDVFNQTKNFLGNVIAGSKRSPLKGEAEGRTNFLLLGTDESAGLTDTIMIASLKYDTKEIATVNIPRDLWVSDNYGSYKINATVNYAEGRNRDKTKTGIAGIEYLSSLISKEYGIDIHYWAKINFNGVKQVVDELSGVDVNVKEDLTDCEYPNDGYKYINGSGYMKPCPSFKKGTEKMNGAKALIYARSRHGSVGGDFDRSERQSIIVQSILQKIKTQGILENAGKISGYLKIVGDNLKTSLKLDEINSLAQILKEINIKDDFLRSTWTTQQDNPFLCGQTSADGASIIVYCDNAVFGKNTISKSRERAKSNIENIFEEARLGELFKAEAAFLGNQSNDTIKAQNEFYKLGFENIKINNSYSKIKPATTKSIEKITIYIVDLKTKELFDRMSKKPNLSAEIKTQLPSDLILTKEYTNAKIIVWVA